MSEVYEYLEENPKVSYKKLSKLFGLSEWNARKIVETFRKDQLEKVEEQELINHTVNLELKNQHLRDQQRVERKIRDNYRKTTHLRELTQELIDCVEQSDTPITVKHSIDHAASGVGIFQLSDAHLNEIIDTPANKYDFDIASKRCEKFVNESIEYFTINKVETVIFAMTGDMINSDRRADEKISMATSRAKACFLAAQIIEQMILALNLYFDIKVAFVVGNESRSFHVGRADIIMSDNYDLTIVSMLKLIFRDTDIEFLDSNLYDCILNIKGHNILLTHGEKLTGGNMQKTIQEFKGKYVQSGVLIDYVLFGHIHETYISDLFARSSSLCGGNGFSDYDLNFSSRASQNIHIINKSHINSIKIDLQDTEGYDGYKFDANIRDNMNSDLNTCKDNFHTNVIKI